MNWMRQAACNPDLPDTDAILNRLTDTLGWTVDIWDVYFPPSTDHPDAFPLRQAAIGICRDCPVQSECVDTAIRRGDYAGIHGGLSSLEKKALAARLRVPGAPLLECGTLRGARRHYREGERLCDGCRRAVREDKRARTEREQARMVAAAG
jgi:hypothetical protein